jgi:hypothetical protein
MRERNPFEATGGVDVVVLGSAEAGSGELCLKFGEAAGGRIKDVVARVIVEDEAPGADALVPLEVGDAGRYVAAGEAGG